MGILDALFGRKKQEQKNSQIETPKTAESVSEAPVAPLETLMTSQLPALYLHTGAALYREHYFVRLMEAGISKGDAQKLFDFESDILRRCEKPYMLNPEFTKLWFFGLKQPFLQVYPKTKEDILKERYFTMSEFCKFIDEAEWHVWNSHEKDVNEAVWEEIYAWRMQGPGIAFAEPYFDMIAKGAGVSEDCVGKLCAIQGAHLSKYRWG